MFTLLIHIFHVNDKVALVQGTSLKEWYKMEPSGGNLSLVE